MASFNIVPLRFSYLSSGLPLGHLGGHFSCPIPSSETASQTVPLLLWRITEGLLRLPVRRLIATLPLGFKGHLEDGICGVAAQVVFLFLRRLLFDGGAVEPGIAIR